MNKKRVRYNMELIVVLLALNEITFVSQTAIYNDTQLTTVTDLSSAKECRLTAQGTEYRGEVDHTWHGKKCEWWFYAPLPTSFVFPDDSIYDSSNNCRNPSNNSFGPWCLYMNANFKISIGYCMIPLCSRTSYTECTRYKISRPDIYNLGRI